MGGQAPHRDRGAAFPPAAGGPNPRLPESCSKRCSTGVKSNPPLLARWGVVLWLWMAGLWIAACAVELVAGPEVEVGTDRATVRWRTDTAAGGRVQWGTNPDKLNQRAQGPVGTNHAVELKGLKPGTTYHLTVGTARIPLASHRFATLGAASSATSSDAGTVGVAGSGGAVGSGGTTASPAAQPQAPPTADTWGSMRTLLDHFDRHGADFGAKDPDDYARRAWLFLQRARKEGLPAKRDADGVLRVFDPATRSFGAYNRDGTTRTFFKPSRRDYFKDQPGRPVQLEKER